MYTHMRMYIHIYIFMNMIVIEPQRSERGSIIQDPDIWPPPTAPAGGRERQDREVRDKSDGKYEKNNPNAPSWMNKNIVSRKPPDVSQRYVIYI
jgi:hypothetical protein